MGYLLIRLPFQGFYNSIHDELIDNTLDRMLENDQADIPMLYSEKYEEDRNASELLWNTANYESICTEYSKEYVKAMNEYIKQELDIDLKLAFESMVSPREYNFMTDRIFAWIPESKMLAIASQVDNKVFDNLVKERFTSYDGFSSFYSNDSESDEWYETPINEMDHNQLQTIFEAWMLTKEFEYNEEDLCLNYIYEDCGIEQIIQDSNQSNEFWDIVDKCYELNYGGMPV